MYNEKVHKSKAVRKTWKAFGRSSINGWSAVLNKKKTPSSGEESDGDIIEHVSSPRSYVTGAQHDFKHRGSSGSLSKSSRCSTRMESFQSSNFQ